MQHYNDKINKQTLLNYNTTIFQYLQEKNNIIEIIKVKKNKVAEF